MIWFLLTILAALLVFTLGLLVIAREDISYLDERLEEEKVINKALRAALNSEGDISNERQKKEQDTEEHY